MAIPSLSRATAPVVTVAPLDDTRSLEIQPLADATILRVRSSVPNERMELELRFTAEGPVVRARAHALELEATRAIVASCERFEVRAEGDIDLRAGGELRCHAEATAAVTARHVAIDASPGAVRLCANDDVQLLGEQILLNCDRLPPMPDWVPPQPHQAITLPPNAVSGDLDVIEELLAARVGASESSDEA